MTITVLADEARVVEGTMSGGRVRVALDDLRDAFGWELKPEGLCRGDVCVPVRDPSRLLHDGRVDLVAVAEALDRPTVVDADAGLLAVGAPRQVRRGLLRTLRAPDFALPDLAGRTRGLDEWDDRKRLLVAFASW